MHIFFSYFELRAAQVNFSDYFLSDVRSSSICSEVLTFSNSSPESMGFMFTETKTHTLSQREMNKNHFNLSVFFKTFFLKTIWPERLKLVWKHPQVVEIQVCSNHDPHEIGIGGSNYIWIFWSSLSLKTIRSEKLKLVCMHLWLGRFNLLKSWSIPRGRTILLKIIFFITNA